MTDQRTGVFVVLEGPDGVGKTTQAKRLAETLRQSGGDIVETREPGAGAAGALIRKILRPPGLAVTDCYVDYDWRAMALLFSADRAVNIKNMIEPYLRDGKIVICDRYYLSTMVYQTAPLWLAYRRAETSGSRDDAYDVFHNAGRWIMQINSWCPTPDLTIVLHSKQATERRARRGETEDSFESDAALQGAVVELYKSPQRWIGARASRIVHIDADADEDTVANRVFFAFTARTEVR